MRRHHLEPSQVCIEITERQEIRCQECTSANIRALRKLGFRIAIDDAGTGHNGLAAIQLLDASVLKLDKFFVDHLHEGERSTAMLDTLVSVAKRIGMRTVAEGVETKEQAIVLREAGIDAFQG